MSWKIKTFVIAVWGLIYNFESLSNFLQMQVDILISMINKYSARTPKREINFLMCEIVWKIPGKTGLESSINKGKNEVEGRNETSAVKDIDTLQPPCPSWKPRRVEMRRPL